VARRPPRPLALPSREALLDYLREAPGRVNKRDIARAFGVKGKDRTALKDLLRELSGVDLADKDASATFLELGFDSLFLTQARQSLQSKFGVKITYRQLSEDLSSLNALAAHIDASLPPEAFPLEPTPAASDPQTSPSGPTPATVPTNRPPVASGVGLPDLPNAQPLSVGSSNLLERLFNQQLQTMSQLMAQQLATLQGSVKGEGRVQNALASHEPTPAPLPGGELAIASGAGVRGKVTIVRQSAKCTKVGTRFTILFD